MDACCDRRDQPIKQSAAHALSDQGAEVSFAGSDEAWKQGVELGAKCTEQADNGDHIPRHGCAGDPKYAGLRQRFRLTIGRVQPGADGVRRDNTGGEP